MSLKLACPRCRHVQFFDDALAGQQVACAKCAQAFRVPRAAEPEAEPAPPSAVLWPWPEQMQARELPTSFAPSEPAAFPVVPLADADPRPDRRRFADDSAPNDDEPNDDRIDARSVATATADPVRRDPRPLGGRPRVRGDEPSGLPWGFGLALISIVLALFVGTAVWFVARDHQPPRKKMVMVAPEPPFQQPQFPQPMPQPFEGPPKFRPMPNRNMQGPDNWAMLREGMMIPIEPQADEQFIPVKLEQGKLRQPGALTFNDPTHPLNPGHHRKVFLVDLEARCYTFEMHVDPPRNVQQRRLFQQGKDLDPFLIVEDSQGKLLKSNDDKEIAVPGGGHDMNSWIPRHRLHAAGTYRVTCTTFAPNETGRFILHIRDEDVGNPVASIKVAARQLPRPVETGQALAVDKTVKRNLEITTIFTSDEPLVGDLCWATDLSAFFVVDRRGTLRRIAWPDHVEERRLDMAVPPSSLAMARSGLLVGFPQLAEVWVIDPATLQVTKRISAPGLDRVTAAPASDIAVAATRQKANPLPKDVLMMLDVAKGVAVRQYDNFSNYSPRLAAMSADGKHVFAEGGIEQLLRYRVQGDEIFLEEESPRLAARGTGVFVSPDGKYVCLPSPGGNHALDPDPARKLEEYTTLIFKADDLRKPAFAVNTGEAPRALGFDPKSGNIFAHNNEKQFMLFRENGFKSREVNLPGADQFSGQPRQFLTHPAGFQVLVRAEHTIYGVELPKDEEK